MKRLLSIILLAAALAAAPAAGQTIKSLGYNTTNGNVVAATNVTFTNSVGFATNARAATRTNLGATTVGDSVFTATNAAAAATAIGLGTSNDVNFNRVQVGGASITTNAFSNGNFEVTSGNALTFVSGGNPATTRTNLGLGETNNVTFSNITANGIVTANDSTATPATNAAAAQGIQWPGLGGSQHAAIYGGYAGAAQIALAVGTSNSISDVATFRATGMTVNSNAIVGGTLTATGNVTMSGVDNLAAQQTASSGSSLMTRELSDARFSPMPMTPQIIPWFYNGTLNVTRVTNGSATLGTLAAYPHITTTTNASDSGGMIMTFDVWGAMDSGNNPWNDIGRSVIIQGRLGATSSNAVARFVWSSSTNWPTLVTNVGAIANLGWAVEIRNNVSQEARLIVNGATNTSVSAFTAIAFDLGNDSSFMVIGRSGLTSLYFAATGEAFSRTPLITVTNQIGGSAAGAATGGLGFSVVNTNTTEGNSTIYIRRCYQVLSMTNYGY